jgi:hypothetical protein
MAILTVETKSGEESLYEILIAQAKGKAAPKKKVEEDDEDIEDEPAPKKGKKSSADEDDEDGDGDADEKDDDWGKEEEEDAWDPDFEEFDLPKSKGKKAAGGVGKKGADEEEDFKVEDDEFKDLFNDDAGFDDDEEDF